MPVENDLLNSESAEARLATVIAVTLSGVVDIHHEALQDYVNTMSSECDNAESVLPSLMSAENPRVQTCIGELFSAMCEYRRGTYVFDNLYVFWDALYDVVAPSLKPIALATAHLLTSDEVSSIKEQLHVLAMSNKEDEAQALLKLKNTLTDYAFS